jgi:hypothetical protein
MSELTEIRKKFYNGGAMLLGRKHQQGFLATSVLVVMALLSVVTLVAIQRSTVTQRIVRQGSEYTDTFGTAEAGVERLIGTDLEDLYAMADRGTLKTSAGDVDYAISTNSDVTGVSIDVGRTYDVVVDGSSSPTFTWVWSGCTLGDFSGILVTVYGTDNEVSRELYYDQDCSPQHPNEVGDATSVDPSGPTVVDLAGVSNPVRVRFKALWSPLVLTVGGSLPTQGYTVEVEATGNANESTTNLLFTQSIPQIPSIFDYAVFSGDQLVQQ